MVRRLSCTAFEWFVRGIITCLYFTRTDTLLLMGFGSHYYDGFFSPGSIVFLIGSSVLLFLVVGNPTRLNYLVLASNMHDTFNKTFSLSTGLIQYA